MKNTLFENYSSEDVYTEFADVSIEMVGVNIDYLEVPAKQCKSCIQAAFNFNDSYRFSN